MTLLERYQYVLEDVRETCVAAGRAPDAAKLMLVTKTVVPERIQVAVDAGHRLFGENKVQELEEKRAAIVDEGTEFHFIGHLQRNKVKKCLECATMVHSVDRVSLARELDKRLRAMGRELDVLIQVNTSEEESKFGVRPEGLLPLVREVAKFPTLRVRGLMTLALFSSDEARVRPCFQLLRRLSEQVREADIDGVVMEELSMGMSGDYRIAIEEGATLVRVGTAVFGHRDTPDSYYWPEGKG